MNEIGELPVVSGFKSKGKEKKTMSRRIFLKRAVIATAGVLAASVMPKAAPEKAPVRPALKKPEKPPAEPVKEKSELISPPLILDVFLTEELKRQFIAKHFGPDFPEEALMEKLGIAGKENYDGFASLVQKVKPKNEKELAFLMLKVMEESYRNHGKNVIEARKAVAFFLGAADELPSSVPILEAIEIEDRITEDELKNPVIWVRIKKEALEKAIAESDSEIVNLSFELGRFGVTYQINKLGMTEEGEEIYHNLSVSHVYVVTGDRTPITTNNFFYKKEPITFEEYQELEEKTKPVIQPCPPRFLFNDGYTGEITEDNLRELVDLARKFPEKTFFAAGGNLTGNRLPDIRTARKKLEEEELWPDNLIIIGAQTDYRPNNVTEYSLGTIGADIYLDKRSFSALGKDKASSFATPVIAEAYYQLRKKGCSRHKAKELLFSLAQIKYLESQEILNYLSGMTDKPVTSADKFPILDLKQAKVCLDSLNQL